jgi:MtN3 and saliva related transmembrane protein
MSIEIIKNIVEICFSAGLFVNALLFVPQIIKLWRTKESKDLSLLTFGGFNLIQIFAILHGCFNQDYILTIGFLLSFITCGTITTQIIFYKFFRKNIAKKNV